MLSYAELILIDSYIAYIIHHSCSMTFLIAVKSKKANATTVIIITYLFIGCLFGIFILSNTCINDDDDDGTGNKCVGV